MWQPDVLGDGWQSRTLTLRPDERGEVVATLVRRVTSTSRRRAVLYLHGYVDYFFQTHLGDFWDAQGFDFYALDLRGYGRSLRAHQVPNDVQALGVYAEELDAAVRIIRAEEGHDVVVLNAHSTGGLVGSLWLHARAGRAAGPVIDAAVLNSPWFELNRPWFDREVNTRAIDVLGRFAPQVVIGQTAPHYGAWLHSPDGGGWTFDLGWKPDEGFGVRAGWFRAIRRGHRTLARGLSVDVPVLVCASTATGPADRDHDAVDRTDSVLDVEHIVGRAPRLGPDVTVVQVPDGVHDLVLSREPARTAYLEAVAAWVGARVPLAVG